MQAVLEAVATHGAENNEYIQQVAVKQVEIAADLANTKEENAKLKCLIAQLKVGGTEASPSLRKNSRSILIVEEGLPRSTRKLDATRIHPMLRLYQPTMSREPNTSR
jgi:hypothetical protein